MRSLETSQTYLDLTGAVAHRDLPRIGETRRLLRFVRGSRHGGR